MLASDHNAAAYFVSDTKDYVIQMALITRFSLRISFSCSAYQDSRFGYANCFRF